MSKTALPCPFCGNAIIKMWDGRGTQAEITCQDCGCGREVQVSDLLSRAERYAGENAFDRRTSCYPAHVVERARQHLLKEWNTRDGIEPDAT